MTQIISRQEPVKRVPRNKTLHQWMCFEAEDVVRYNWADVACHDLTTINKMRPGDTRLWVIHELGSLFLPLYCKMHEKRKQEESEYEFSSLEINMLRMMKDDPLASIQNKIIRETAQFYFIRKGFGNYDYNITPSDFRSVMDFTFCGKASRYLD